MISTFKGSALMEKNSEVEKHFLGSGIPCVKHKCMKCCIETSMPLSRSDMKRILKEGYQFRDFAVKIGKEWCLRNSSGRCIFSSEGVCKIYSFRPEGCRIYPLVYDENTRKAMLDPTCPYGYDFEVREEDVKNLKILLKRLKKETRREYRQPPARARPGASHATVLTKLSYT